MRLRSGRFMLVAVCALAMVLALPAMALADDYEFLIEELGDELFEDTRLSTPPGQACETCHAGEVGYTGPDSALNEMGSVYPGAIHKRFGNRKPPSSAYGGDSPVLYYDEDDEAWVGGMFWDGRATGWTLGDPLAEQAMGPFLNPLEQNMPNANLVVFRVSISPYADLYELVWGERPDFTSDWGVALSYERIARSIAAYERSSVVNPFDSPFDAFWDATKTAGLDASMIDTDNWMDYSGYGLSDEEVWGFAVFNDEDKGKCGLCHTLDEGKAGYPLFTDFTYDNLGIPRNEDNPFYAMPRRWNPDGYAWTDPGLGGFLKSIGEDEDTYLAEWGDHKVPTLRNVDKRSDTEFVKAYGHNGYFKSLEEAVSFYNTRDVDPTWPVPEVAENVNTDELGDLGLTADEEAAIVTFMGALSDTR